MYVVASERQRVKDGAFGRHAQIFVGDSMEKLAIVRVINCCILTHEVDPVCGVCDVYISFGCLRETVCVCHLFDMRALAL